MKLNTPVAIDNDPSWYYSLSISPLGGSGKSTMNKELKTKNLHRIKIIEGHIKAIKKMLENDAYCVDIVHQSMAVQRALRKLDMKVLENHLKTHVTAQFKNGKNKQAVEELLSIYDIK